MEKMNQKIIKINQEIQENTIKLNELEKQMNHSESQINELETDIKGIEEKIEKRNEILKERLLSYQEIGGNSSYLQIVLGANNFSDFVERVDSVSTIVQADQDLLEQQNDEKGELENKIQIVKMKREEWSKLKEQIEHAQSELWKKDEQYENILPLFDQKRVHFQSEDTGQDLEVPVSNTIGSGKIEKIIKAGYNYIGNSVYVFGGGRTESDIRNGKFDCSSFVHWAFGQAGIEIGTTTDSIKNNGRQVSKSELRSGDLVFFDTYKKDGHVGIYLGNGKFIGAQSSTGVAIADMSNGYWKDRYNGRNVRIID